MQRSGMPVTDEDMTRITRFYETHSAPSWKELPSFAADSKLHLQGVPLAEQGRPPSAEGVPPALAMSDVTSINTTDLDRDGHPDVLVTRRWGPPTPDTPGILQWHFRRDGEWRTRELAVLDTPVHTASFDDDHDGKLEIVVADIGSLFPSDELGGRVVLLHQVGELEFRPQVLLSGVGRVADVRPGDFDGDGDTDYALAIFGYYTPGQIAWLENAGSGSFALHTLDARSGGVNVIPADLDADGRLDVVALLTQEHEQIVVYLNRGGGKFESRVLFAAPTPLFGSSGMDLVDLDRDGDLDVLFTNGDSINRVLIPWPLRPFHGVEWLENKGSLSFAFHDIVRYYGAYRAVPSDLDGDGDLDIAVVSAVHGPGHVSVIWLENDGKQRFSPHAVSSNSDLMSMTAAVGDFDEDGKPEILAGGLMGLWWFAPETLLTKRRAAGE